MKTLKYLIIGLISISTVQCSKEESNLSDEKLNSETSNKGAEITKTDIQNAVETHRNGLDYIIKNFDITQTGKKYKRLKGKGQVSEMLNIESLRTIDSLSKEFIKKSNVTFNDIKVDSLNYKFSDEELLVLGGLSKLSNKGSLNSISEEYRNEIIEIYNSGYENEILKNELNRVIEEAENELDNEKIIPLKMMVNILLDSDLIWNANLYKKGYSSRVSVNIALADATDAYSAGTWGLIAGPLGAAVLAVNGALIGSSSAYILSQI